MSTTYSEVEDAISAILEAINWHKPVNIAKLAREHGVLYQRLLARANGRQSKCERPTTLKKFTEEQEASIHIYLQALDDIGTSARLWQLRKCANSILARIHDGKGPPPVIGQHWPARFLQANLQYQIRKQKLIELARKQAHDLVAIYDWFQRTRAIMNALYIQPADLYNMDETGFRIGIAGSQWIITLSADRQSYLASSENRELVTDIETVLADGSYLPNMLIL